MELIAFVKICDKSLVNSLFSLYTHGRGEIAKKNIDRILVMRTITGILSLIGYLV